MGKFQDLMERELRIRGMAESTRKLYLQNMRGFVRGVGRMLSLT